MTEVRFYHLTKTPLDHALPQILGKALQGNFKIVIKSEDEKSSKHLNDWLWAFSDDSFLPHDIAGGENDNDQPILISHDDTHIADNKNAANMIVLTNGCTYDDLEKFDLCCEMLNGHDETQVAQARKRWKSYQEKGFDITYWAQNEQGGWEKKA